MTDWIDKLQALPEVPGELQGAYLVRCCNALELVPQTIVELGVFQGQTTRQVREGFPEAHIYLIDPWEYDPKNQGQIYSRVYSQEKWDMVFEFVRGFWESDPNITILRDKSSTAAKYFQDDIDLIFIDGDHSYEAVREDIVEYTGAGVVPVYPYEVIPPGDRRSISRILYINDSPQAYVFEPPVEGIVR